MSPFSIPARAVGAALICLLVAGCLLLPGKFASELAVRRDGTFAFSYRGDVHVLAFTKMAQNEMDGATKFEPEPCFDEADREPRECSAQELAAQRSAWEAAQEAGKAKRTRDAEMTRQLLGGIDPSDPRAAEELAERMRKQAGWRSVEYLGDGKYLVDFAIAGRLDHDFTFPSVERLPGLTPFVALYLRADGSVRIDAPAFSARASGGPMGAMMQGMGADKATPTGMPVLDGTFAIVTDGEILANNTDDGPRADAAGMRRLAWTVTPRTEAAPTALIQLGR